MRTLKRNKNVTLRYANRVEGADITLNEYGEVVSEYGDIKEVSLFVTQLQNEYEAQYYGVDRSSTKKVIMDSSIAKDFREFTRVWVDVEPNEAKSNNDYYVSTLPIVGLNISTMTITKVKARK